MKKKWKFKWWHGALLLAGGVGAALLYKKKEQEKVDVVAEGQALVEDFAELVDMSKNVINPQLES